MNTENTNGGYENRALMKPNKQGLRAAVASLLLLPVAAWAGGVVTNCTEADLRAAMAGGGVVTFACDGTITLASTITNVSNTTLDGSGRQVIISGNAAVRVFCVNTNVNFTIINLTVANGLSQSGSAILNVGGTVNLTGIAFQSNAAHGTDGVLLTEAYGGAIFNSGGNMNATQCTFERNRASTSWQPTMGSPYVGRPARGGAIYNSGTATLDLCTFNGNSATGADGSSSTSASMEGLPGGEGAGGAIYNKGALTVDRSMLNSNTATGGHGGRGGDGIWQTLVWGWPGGFGARGAGGAICNAGSLWVARSTFASNVVVGGYGGAGGNSLGAPDPTCLGGDGGAGGAGDGGALGCLGGTQIMINCTIVFNTGSGGNGGRGGNGSSSGAGRGGNGGGGGAGCGGGGSCNLTNCTIAWNAGSGGTGGAAGTGSPNGTPGANGSAYGGTVASTLVNSLIASNTPAGGDSFVDPKLGPLADNGGPTLTMALLPGSPAIDAGNTSLAPATDQRGVPRPFSLAADIGAFEFWPTLRASPTGSCGINILASGISGQTCRLLASSNFLNWMPLATNQIGSDGTTLFYDTCAPGGACRYYRLVMP